MRSRTSSRFMLVLVLAVAATATGCGKQAAPVVDLAAEEAAIRQAGRNWLAAEVAKDVPKIVSFYAEDAIEMASNTPMIEGRDAIRSGMKPGSRRPVSA